MNQNKQILQDGDDIPISIGAQWSNQYFSCGTTNKGKLAVTSTSPGRFVLKKGDQIKVEANSEAGWKLVPTDTKTWTVVQPDKTRSLFYLQYNGGIAVNLTTWMLKVVGDDGEKDSLGDNNLEVELKITPPAKAKALLTVQLLDSNSSPISDPCRIAANYIEPGVPLAAYALNPAVVLLTGNGTLNFPNSIGCNLLNQSGKRIKSASLEISLSAFDKDYNPINIKQSLGQVKILGDLKWQYSDATQSWTATLNGPLDNGSALNILISELVLGYTTIPIATVEAVVTVNGADGHAPYQTSGRFQAYGPYTLVLVLDNTESTAKYYSLSGDGDIYNINALNDKLRQPPLLPRLTDADNNIVYPPVVGAFSWDRDQVRFNSGHELKNGDNPLYFLVQDVKGEYQSLTNCLADYNFYPQEISASGFNQAYGNATPPKFGPIMPRGAIIMWHGTSLPDGWVYCDGDCFPGSQEKTPDLRSQFIVAYDNKNQNKDYNRIGNQGGAAQVALSIDNLPEHQHNIDHGHTVTDPGHAHNIRLSDSTRCCNMVPNGNDSYPTGYHVSTDVSKTNIHVDAIKDTESGKTGKNTPYDNRPPYYTLAFIIKV